MVRRAEREGVSTEVPVRAARRRRHWVLPVTVLLAGGAAMGWQLDQKFDDVDQRADRQEQTVHALEGKLAASEQKNELLTQQLARLAGVDSTTIDRTGLQEPPKLLETSSPEALKTLEQLKRATAVLFSRQKGSQSSWSPTCTAAMVSLQGMPYALTAGHCFQLTYSNNPPVDLLKRDPREYMLAQYNAADTSKVTMLAMVKTAAYASVDSNQGPDYTLLGLATTSDFDSTSVIPIDSMGSVQPMPGEQVALVSMDLATSRQQIVSTGEYLARIPTVANAHHTGFQDLIGFHSTVAQQDCPRGGSGSLGITLASGALVGPASLRVVREQIAVPAGINSDDILQSSLLRSQAENRSGLNLDPFNNVCLMEAVPAGSLTTLANFITANA